MENTVLQDYVYNWSRCLFLTSVIHTMQKKNGHNSCTVPTLWPSFRYFSWSLNSGNLECISYRDIKYFTAKKLKREQHSFAFPYFMHFPFLITFHILSVRSAFNPRRMRVLDLSEHEENQQICGMWQGCVMWLQYRLLHSLFLHVSAWLPLPQVLLSKWLLHCWK